MKRLEKSNFNIQMLCGMHGSAKHAGTSRKAIDDFRPHVYVAENNILLEKDRYESNTNINAFIRYTRGNMAMKDAFMEAYRKSMSHIQNLDFEAAQLQIIIEGNNGCRPIFYNIEGYTQSELAEFDNAYKRMDASYASALACLCKGNPIEAVKLLDAAERGFARDNTLKRDLRSAENFCELVHKIPSLYPNLAELPQINILVRYGSFHEALPDLLIERGFENISTSKYSCSLPFVVQAKLVKNPTTVLSDDELLGGLFTNLYIGIYPAILNLAEHEIIAGILTKFANLGGVPAMVKIAEDYARKSSGNVKGFIAFIKNAFTD